MIKLFFLITGTFSITFSYAQSRSKNYSIENDIGNTIRLYDQFTASNAPLYNGKRYIYYNFRMIGDPFFVEKGFTKGWVCYQGKKYNPVELLYDLSRNELVVLNANGEVAIVLHNEMVDSFYISQSKFINLKEDTSNYLIHAGFYNLLHDGEIQLFAKRAKLMSDSLGDKFIFKKFFSLDRFYFQKKGTYYPVSNSKEVFAVLSDKKKELRKRMRKEHIKLKRNNFESSLVKVAALYEQITQ